MVFIEGDVMYEVTMNEKEYSELPCFDKWWNDLDIKIDFNDWLPTCYPEVILVEWGGSDSRTFTFESEEMYHWFLLKQ